MESTGRVVVITGAARGIGRAIAERFLENGDKVAILDMLDEAAREWTSGNENALVVKCNITQRTQVQAAKEQVLAKFGGINVLVNNAGVSATPARFEDIDEAEWRRMFDINVHGMFICSQVFGIEMLDRDGAIVNIASTSGLEPGKNTGAYSATKAAVLMLTKQIAIQWGERKVRCNSVSPGLLLTDINKAYYERPGVRESREGAIPLGHIGETVDIANAVFFLASPEAKYITSANLVVDGGFVANGLAPLKVTVD